MPYLYRARCHRHDDGAGRHTASAWTCGDGPGLGRGYSGDRADHGVLGADEPPPWVDLCRYVGARPGSCPAGPAHGHRGARRRLGDSRGLARGRRGPGASEGSEMTADEPLIHARGLTKTFGDFVAVDSIDVDVAPGESFGFLGPNGAGKSSPMRMIGCVSQATGGKRRVLGCDAAMAGAAHRGIHWGGL